MRYSAIVLKSLHSCALLTFGIGTNILSLKSSEINPEWYILLIRRVIICIPLSPMHCNYSSPAMLSLPQAFSFRQISDHSFNLFATDCVHLTLHLTLINAGFLSSGFIP